MNPSYIIIEWWWWCRRRGRKCSWANQCSIKRNLRRHWIHSIGRTINSEPPCTAISTVTMKMQLTNPGSWSPSKLSPPKNIMCVCLMIHCYNCVHDPSLRLFLFEFSLSMIRSRPSTLIVSILHKFEGTVEERIFIYMIWIDQGKLENSRQSDILSLSKALEVETGCVQEMVFSTGVLEWRMEMAQRVLEWIIPAWRQSCKYPPSHSKLLKYAKSSNINMKSSMFLSVQMVFWEILLAGPLLYLFSHMTFDFDVWWLDSTSSKRNQICMILFGHVTIGKNLWHDWFSLWCCRCHRSHRTNVSLYGVLRRTWCGTVRLRISGNFRFPLKIPGSDKLLTKIFIGF